VKIKEVAEGVERQIHDAFGFEVKSAHIFGVTLNGDDGEIVLGKPQTHGDVYRLLESNKARSLAKKAQFVAILTCGWAAPVDDPETDDVPPSVHPRRRRVRLVVVANRDGVASVLRFEDDADETLVDEGKAHGTLADSICELFAR
jgi:hypothetical protein